MNEEINKLSGGDFYSFPGQLDTNSSYKINKLGHFRTKF